MQDHVSPTRRDFMARSAALASGLIATRGLARSTAANDRVNVAVVGAGGRGAENLKGLEGLPVNIVALCDCDDRRGAESFARYPDAKRYKDWRRLLDDERNLDAVVVATPDHNHAIIAVHAMRLGKHVYCEKPLAHSIWEARLMAQAAAENRVATQMGTQGHAFEGSRQAVEVIRCGAIGQVRELHVWTDRPAGWWPSGIERPTSTPPVPPRLDWDVWLGPAPARPYNPAYVPFKWRGFWDFGTGAIGDMGVHNLDTAFWALELTAPTAVEVKACGPALGSSALKETGPSWSIIEMQFPARGVEQPPVAMTYYDGGKLPPAELFHGEPIPTRDGGSLVIGSKGTLLTRTWHGGENKGNWFVLLPRDQYADYPPPSPTLPRTPSHWAEWIAACRGRGGGGSGGGSGGGGAGPPLSNFGYASVLTESLLLGNVALRTGKRIEWDAANMRAANCPEADRCIRPALRDGWTM